MSNDDNKKQWKKDAEQLKKDLDNRTKIYKKNPVKISFPKKPVLNDIQHPQQSNPLFHNPLTITPINPDSRPPK